MNLSRSERRLCDPDGRLSLLLKVMFITVTLRSEIQCGTMWKGQTCVPESTELAIEHDVPALQPPGDWFIAGACILIIAVSGFDYRVSLGDLAYFSMRFRVASGRIQLAPLALRVATRRTVRHPRRAVAAIVGRARRRENSHGPLGPEWPAQFADLQRRIIIDFGSTREMWPDRTV